MYLFLVESGKRDVAVQDFSIVIMMQQLGNFLQMYTFHSKRPSESGCPECKTEFIACDSLEHLAAGFLHSS